MKKLRLITCLLLVALVTTIVLPVAAVQSNTQDLAGQYEYQTISDGLRQFIYSDEMLFDNARDFSVDLTKASVSLSYAAYSINMLLDAEKEMGYKIVGGGKALYDRATPTIDECDLATYTIGYKEQIGPDGKSYGIYSVVVRGTYNAEWISNFNIGTEADHEGFYKGAKMLSDELEALFDDDGLEPEERIIWFTGHSRGAGIVNIVAGQMTDSEEYAPQEQIFCYGFACPSVSTALTEEQTSYSNIYSFNNPGDLVPGMAPVLWGYKRYGITYDLSSAHKLNMLRRFEQENGEEYQGLSTSDHYLDPLMELIPDPDTAQEPMMKFVLLLIGYFMGGNKELTLEDCLNKSGIYLEHAQLLAKVKDPTLSIRMLIEDFIDAIDSTESLKEFTIAHRKKVAEMTDEEFFDFCNQHPDQIRALGQTFDMQIETTADFLQATGRLGGTILNTAQGVYDAVVLVSDIILTAEGDLLEAITHAHTAETYVMWINSMYYGYRGWYQSTALTSVDIKDMRSIGAQCFTDCTELKTLYLPVSAVYDASDSTATFEGCSALESIAYYNSDGVTFDPQMDRAAASWADESLKVLVFEDGIRKIPAYAGYKCKVLASVRVPSSIEAIGSHAFSKSSLKQIDLPEGLTTIEYGAFASSQLESVEIPSTLEKLEDYAFGYCEQLGGEVVIPDAVTTIPKYAFCDCRNLSSVILGDGIETIDHAAFVNCVSLKNLQIPVSATYEWPWPFEGCSGLETLTFTVGNGTVFTPEEHGRLVKWSTETLKELTFGEGIEEVPAHIAMSCTALERVNLPTTLLVIGNEAFEGCTALAKIGTAQWLDEGNTGLCLPDAVTTIGYDAFMDVPISQAILPDTLETIGGLAFYSCDQMTYLQHPISASYDWGTFSNCSALEKIRYTKGDGTAFTADENEYPAYFSKTTLQEVLFDEGVTGVPANVAKNCTELRRVSLPKTLKQIGASAFENCGKLQKVTLCEKIVSIGDHAFSGTGLLQITLPTGLESIGGYAFSNCTALGGKIVLPETLTAIPYGVFLNCSALEEVIIGNNIESIDGFAFGNCTALRSLQLPVSAEYYGSGYGHCTFQNCSALKKIHYTPGNGTAFEMGSNYYAAYWAQTSLEEMAFDEGITEIPAYTAMNCTALTKVALPSTLQTIGWQAFDGCTALQSVSLPEGLKAIDGYAFRKTGLTALSLPDSLETLGAYCFQNCKNLAGKVTLDADLTIVPKNLFYGCSALEEVVIGDEISEIHGNAFGCCVSLKKLQMPISAVYNDSEAKSFWDCTALEELRYTVGNGTVFSPYYQGGAAYWAKASLKALYFDEGITAVPAYTANGSTVLEEVRLPSTLKTIGNNTFTNCRALKTVSLPNGMEAIGNNAFQGSGLISLSLPNTIETLGDSCFAGCRAISGTVILPEGLTVIENSLFNNCIAMEELVIGDRVTTIGERAIAYCPSLKKLQMPISAVYNTDWYDATFNDLTALDELCFTAGNGTVFAPNGGKKVMHFSLNKLIYAEGVTAVQDYAAQNCRKLQSIEFPSTLKSIGTDSFRNCPSLTQVQFPKGVTTINPGAFIDCDALTTATFLGDAPQSLNGVFPASTTIRYRSDTNGWTVNSEYNGVTNTYSGYPLDCIKIFSIAGCNMTLGNELELNIFLPKATVDAYNKELTATVTHHAVDEDVVYTWSVSELPEYSGGKYYKTSIRVAAAQMTDLVDIVVTDSEGNIYNNEYVTSVLTYVTNNIDKQKATAKTLLVDMVNYGTAAQDNFKYRQDLYANSTLTEAHRALATPAVACTDIRIQGTNYKGSNLSLKDQILLNFFFKAVDDATMAEMYATVEFTGVLGNKVQETVDPIKKSGYTCVAVDQIVLADSVCPVTVTIYNADGTVYGYATDSVESYNARQNPNDTNALYNNIMKFATSALAYKK